MIPEWEFYVFNMANPRQRQIINPGVKNQRRLGLVFHVGSVYFMIRFYVRVSNFSARSYANLIYLTYVVVYRLK